MRWKIKEKFYRDAIEEYAKRLTRYCKLEIIEVADEKTPDGASATEEMQIRQKEGACACPPREMQAEQLLCHGTRHRRQGTLIRSNSHRNWKNWELTGSAM